ncbi:hypothetical protein BKA62DRAFT_769232 [Auriculariales sp. MPI-PUGE-AT-0066]|nr:hypothetical protein BKA62DRAFT_769232 [Auriculariales sp. MPI-PUGE-AT-0066]
MKSLRRSLVNKDSSAPQGNSRISTPVSLPTVGKPTSAMMPPTKVIKAVQSYRSQAPQELSFNKGDFFHVVRDVDRGTSQYFEANNPMTGARGLVPRDLFEEFGKADTARITSISAGPRNTLNTTNVQRPPPGAPGISPVNIGQPSPASPSAPGKQTYYAIVMHDFSAERPDELDARQGEAITIVAQSNREWFVGKPIGKLGRPGLIPISFVELRDPTSGQAVTDIMALLDRGEIPLVEEWKKAMNQYKAASIPLGVIDDPSYGGVPNSPFQRQPDRNSALGFGSPGGSQDFSQPGPPPQQPPNSQQQNIQDPQPQDQPQYTLLPEGLLYSADVGSFHFENGEYWFRINAVFQPEDLNGGPPPNALQLVLFRVYNDFYDFQITLLENFPIEAGREPHPNNPSAEPERILPYMPGPVASVDAVVTAERCTELDEYVRNLSQLREIGSEHILRHELVRSFFCPRDGDAEQEIEPVIYQNTGYAQEDDDQRYADQMRDLNVADQRDDRYYNDNGYPQQQQQQDQGYGGGQGRSSQYERGHERGPSRSNGARSRNDSGPSAPSQRSSGGGGGGGGPDGGGWDEYGPQHQSQNSYGGGANGVRPGSRMSGGPTSNAPAISASNPNSAYIKIKIFDRNTDDLIAIRVPPRVTHQQLMDKVRERLGKDVSVLRYRNSMTGRFDDLVEHDLKHWLESADKLVLYAD